MKKRLIAPLLLASLSLHAADNQAAPAPTDIDPTAIRILNEAVDYLANAKHFAASAEIWKDERLEDGSNYQSTKLIDIRLRRPDRVRLDVRTTGPIRSYYFNGKQLTVFGRETGFYGTVDAPDSIDKMLTAVDKKAGVTFPLEDLLISRPFGDGAKKAKSAHYFGVESVLGTKCHHLAFQNETIDWQAWIEDGIQPLMRKVVITFKDDNNSPQLTAILDNWDFSTVLGDHLFTFSPPEGAIKIDMLPANEIGGDVAAEAATEKSE